MLIDGYGREKMCRDTLVHIAYVQGDATQLTRQLGCVTRELKNARACCTTELYNFTYRGCEFWLIKLSARSRLTSILRSAS